MHQVSIAKKLVIVTTTSISLIVANQESLQELEDLDQIFYNCYSILFQKKIEKIKIMVLINYISKIIAINITYTAKLGLQMQKTEIGASKIDSCSFKTYGIVIATFQIFNKLDYLRFF